MEVNWKSGNAIEELRAWCPGLMPPPGEQDVLLLPANLGLCANTLVRAILELSDRVEQLKAVMGVTGGDEAHEKIMDGLSFLNHCFKSYLENHEEHFDLSWELSRLLGLRAQIDAVVKRMEAA